MAFFEWLDDENDHRRWGVRVAPSKLLNQKESGLFATKDFAKEEKIAPYLGEELTADQRKQRYQGLWGPYIYFKPWGHPSIDAQFYRGAAAFANDGTWRVTKGTGSSGTYTKRPVDLSNARLERGNLIANKPIHKGEEILLNYGEGYWKRRFTGLPERGNWQPRLLFPDEPMTPMPTARVVKTVKPVKTVKAVKAVKEQMGGLFHEAKKSNSQSGLEGKNRRIQEKLTELTPVEKRGDIWFKRDDLFEYAGMKGGKVRTCLAYILDEMATRKNHRKRGIKGVISGGSRSSPQVQIVGTLATDLGLEARLHLPKGKLPSYIEKACKGHIVKQWFPGYNHVISARVNEDTQTLNESGGNNEWLEIPFGMELEKAVDLTAEQVKNLPFDDPAFRRIVVPVGSGMTLAGIIEGLQLYGPTRSIPILGVVVGQDPSKRLDKWIPGRRGTNSWKDYVTLVNSEQDYHDPAPTPDTIFKGIDLDPIYEAKTVPLLEKGDLLWIVGHR